MNIVITSESDKIEAKLDRRFGRAAWFCLYNAETGQTSFIRNEYVISTGGAGTKSGELMVRLKVQKVFSGDFGPKAKVMLEKFNIQMITFRDEEQTVNDIINSLQNNNNMPGLDHTGPLGQGPRTGRRMGKCAPKNTDGTNSANNVPSQRGRGMGRNQGKGLGLANRFGRQK